MNWFRETDAYLIDKCVAPAAWWVEREIGIDRLLAANVCLLPYFLIDVGVAIEFQSGVAWFIAGLSGLIVIMRLLFWMLLARDRAWHAFDREACLAWRAMHTVVLLVFYLVPMAFAAMHPDIRMFGGFCLWLHLYLSAVGEPPPREEPTFDRDLVMEGR